MPRMSTVKQSLLEPATPPTDIRGAHLPETGRFIIEEYSDNPDAWLYIDDDHVHQLRGME